MSGLATFKISGRSDGPVSRYSLVFLKRKFTKIKVGAKIAENQKLSQSSNFMIVQLTIWHKIGHPKVRRIARVDIEKFIVSDGIKTGKKVYFYNF
jgi:hypothetical protein